MVLTLVLTFRGKAAEAIRFHVAVFPGGEVGDLETYGPDEAGAEGTSSGRPSNCTSICTGAVDSLDDPIPETKLRSIFRMSIGTPEDTPAMSSPFQNRRPPNADRAPSANRNGRLFIARCS
jgi:hypothetical protein